MKIRFRMTPKAADLREMAYKGQKLTALKKINDALMAREGLVYTPWTVSRICAFYLTLGYSNEHEVRLIVKRHEGGLDRRQDCSVHKVWPIPIAPLGCSTGDEFCKVELVDVTAGAGSSSARVRSVLENTPFSGVLVHP